MAITITLAKISEEYHELNGTYFETIQSPPSPLEFSRLVHISRPVLIKGLELPKRLGKLWTTEYLTRQMGTRRISVAVTPNGRADAVTTVAGRSHFAEPLVESMTMGSLFEKLEAGNNSEIHYLQSQNGNLYTSRFFEGVEDSSEFEPLRQDVPSEISFCSEALDKSPDAVNIWLGDSRSVTSVHSDPYENIYCVIRGAKHFTLFPPTDSWCMAEQMYPRAKYIRTSPTAEMTIGPLPDPPEMVRWSSILDPDTNPPLGSHPIQITVEAGETLYLPAGWWHHVRQSESGQTCALNWWYDIEMSGMGWVTLSFLRSLPAQNIEEDVELEFEA